MLDPTIKIPPITLKPETLLWKINISDKNPKNACKYPKTATLDTLSKNKALL